MLDILLNMVYNIDSEKGHSEHEILELIRRIVGANQREEE